jgi:hypothetical protein
MATLQLDMFTTTDDPHNSAPVYYIGRCRKCKRTMKRTAADLKAYGNTRYSPCTSLCRDYGMTTHVEMHQIKGTYNPRVKCDARCQGATGPVCECSCNGANHGGRA